MVKKVTRVFWKEKHLVFMGILLVENGHLWIPVCNAPSNNIATNCGVNFYVLWLQVPVFYSWVESFQQNSGLLFFFFFFLFWGCDFS
jgi:hypothetical protein